MKIRNLKTEALVTGEPLNNPSLYEWRTPSADAEGSFDASSCSHTLIVRCANCGMQVDEVGQTGLFECPDCGEEDFDVQQLFEREVVDVVGVEFEVTGRESRRFLHITLPPEWKKAKVFYTLDGSTPTTKSFLYRHPFAIDRNSYVVKVMLYTADKKSNLISYFVSPVDGFRYICPICASQIISAPSAAQCGTCGFVRTFYTDGSTVDTPVGIICPVCSTEFSTAVSPAQCPKCGSKYEFIKSGEGWTYKGHEQVCPSCFNMFNCRVGSREHCPRCGAHVVYSHNSWVLTHSPVHSGGSSGALPPRRKRTDIPTYNPNCKVTWSSNSDSLGAILFCLLVAIIVILVQILQH